MTTMNDDSRLGRLEGRVEEQTASMQEIRQDMRSGFQRVDARFDRLDARFGRADGRADGLDARIGGINRRLDLLLLAYLGVGAAQIGLLITLLLRGV